MCSLWSNWTGRRPGMARTADCPFQLVPATHGTRSGTDPIDPSAGVCWFPGSGNVCQAWVIGGHPERSVDIAQAQLA